MYSEIASLPAWVVLAAQLMLALAMALAGWRAWKGPVITDRVVALDLLASLIMGQCVLLVVTSGFISFLDVAGAIAVISFLATIAFARYLESQSNP